MIATEHANAHEAIQHSGAEGSEAILIDGRYATIAEADAFALIADGREFAWLCDVNGSIVTIPVNAN